MTKAALKVLSSGKVSDNNEKMINWSMASTPNWLENKFGRD